MENTEPFSSSTAPLTWHDFLERMRQPSAAEFVKAIKSFIVSFSNNAPDAERDSMAVQQFLANMESAFRAHPLWSGCSEEELESAGEGLEKYVMTKLYSRVFASLPEDIKVDEQLSEKMALVQQFIRPEHLDIKPPYQNETSWLLAQKELQKINMFKAPREKIVCILNCCKVITNLLLNASVASDDSPPGADEFLPVLIFVTLKANPPQLHSNLQYIQRYRRQTRLVSETAYYFTNMLSAVSFILDIDAKSLSMDATEFEKNMESAKMVLSGLASSEYETNSGLQSPAKSNSMEYKHESPYGKDYIKQPQLSPLPSGLKSDSREQRSNKDQLSTTKTLSLSDLEEKGANTLLKEDQFTSVFHEFPYVFAKAGDLTLQDVEDLLINYKKLVLKYACLAKGLGIEPTTFKPPLHEGQQDKAGSAKGSEEKEKTVDTGGEVGENASRREDYNQIERLLADKESSEAGMLDGKDVELLKDEATSEPAELLKEHVEVKE